MSALDVSELAEVECEKANEMLRNGWRLLKVAAVPARGLRGEIIVYVVGRPSVASDGVLAVADDINCNLGVMPVTDLTGAPNDMK